jgi:hypothetical protein
LEQLVEAKVNKMPVPKDEIPQSTGKVINPMDALRKSLSSADASAGKRVPKKPVASVKAEPNNGMGLVKGTAKDSEKIKSA